MAAVVEYIPRDSFMHRLNPLTKIVWSLLVLGVAIIFDHYTYMFSLMVMILAIAAGAKIIKEISRFLKGLIIFAAILFMMQVLFYTNGEVLFYLIPVGKGFLGITREGIFISLAMAFRMLAILLSFLVFLATTKTQDMVNIIVEKLNIPYDYAFMFLTSMRFIPTFMNEIKQISDAQKARGFVLEGWNPIKKVKAYLPISVPLVLLSLKKAQQMALAMETRGYGTGERTHLRDVQINVIDIFFIVIMIILLGLAVTVRVKGYGTMF